MPLAVSTMRAAILTRRTGRVVKSAVASGWGLGMASLIPSIIHIQGQAEELSESRLPRFAHYTTNALAIFDAGPYPFPSNCAGVARSAQSQYVAGMTTYEILQERDGVFEAWAILASGEDGVQRYVSRYLSEAQAQTMIDRLQAMAEAQHSVRSGMPG
jgi:hypothetical protein